jgi:hypothetical protein
LTYFDRVGFGRNPVVIPLQISHWRAEYHFERWYLDFVRASLMLALKLLQRGQEVSYGLGLLYRNLD